MSLSAAFSRERRGLLIAIVVFAAGLRLLAWQRALVMTNDGPDFLWQAARLREGDWAAALSHPYHPLYGAAIAALSVLTGDTLSAAVAISVGAGVLIVLAVAALARRAFPHEPAAAPAAALLAAVHSRSITTTADVQSDGLFLALFLLSAVALLAAVQRGGCRRRMALAGVLAGLAYLARPEGLFLLAGSALAVVATARSGGAARSVTGAAAFAVGLVVTAAPYIISLHELSGEWPLSLKPSVASAGLGVADTIHAPPRDSPLGSPKVHRLPRDAAATRDEAPAPPTAAPREGRLLMWPSVVVQPLHAPPASQDEQPVDEDGVARRPAPLAQSIGVLLTTLRQDTLPIVGVGLVLLWRARRGLCLALLALVAGWVALAARHVEAHHYLSARHMLAPALLLMPLGGAGLLALWRAAAGLRVLQLIVRSLLVAILLLHAGTSMIVRHRTDGPRLAALAWAAERTDPQQRLGVHRRKDGWYAGRPVLQVDLPCSDESLLAAMKEWDAPLLVLDEVRVRQHEPSWLNGGPFVAQARFGEGEDAVIVLAGAPPPG